MSEDKKPSWIKRLTGYWGKEIAPHTKRAYEELGEAAKDLKPHVQGAGKIVKDYAGKVQAQVKDGVKDAKDVASELTARSEEGEKKNWRDRLDEAVDKTEDLARKAGEKFKKKDQ